MWCVRQNAYLVGFAHLGNLVLENTIERLFVKQVYANVDRGLFIVRGENVLLLGEIDLDKDDHIPPPYELAPVEEVFRLKKLEEADKTQRDQRNRKKLAAQGFEGEHAGEAIL